MAEKTLKPRGQVVSTQQTKQTEQHEQGQPSEVVLSALANPSQMRPADVLRLQRTVGNQAINRLLGHSSSAHRIQTKLTVGAAHDPLEQEADQVAQQVLTRPAPAGPALQRQQEAEMLQAKPLAATITRLVQRSLEEEEAVQAKGSLADCFEAGEDVQSALENSKNGGSALPADLRGYMEPRFGANFSTVRLHTDSQSAQLNRKIGAQAFTHGQHIYMGEGRFDPGSDGGKRLLAHELTHTIQQTGGIQRFAETSANLKALGEGKTFFGLRNTNWGNLVDALDAYEKAGTDDKKKKSAVEQILKYTQAWLDSSARKKNAPGDEQKREMVEKLQEEARFESSYKTELYSTPEKAGEVGKQFFARSREQASSQTVGAVTKGKEEMYATGSERVRQLYGILMALKGGQLTLNYRSFELVQSLLSGGEGMPALYAKFKHQADPSKPEDPAALSNDLGVFKNWKSSPDAELSFEALKSVAETGTMDPKYKLLFHLGKVDGNKVTGSYALEVFESYFNTSLLTSAVPSSGLTEEDNNKQIDEFIAKRQGLETFLTSKDVPMPGAPSWRWTRPWFWVNSNTLDQIGLTMGYVDAIIAAGQQRKRGGAGLKAQLAIPAQQIGAQGVIDGLIKSSIDRLLGYLKAKRGSIYTTDAESQEMIGFVDQWKKETLTLEEKFGLDQHSIGKKVRDDKMIDFFSGKGLGRDQISHILDIVSGEVGNIYQTIGKNKKDATATQTTDDGATKVAQAIAHHHERQLVVTTEGDVNALADDLVEIGKSDPKALLAYLLDLLGPFAPAGNRKLTPADFDGPPSTTFTLDQRNEAINQAMQKMEAKLGIRKLGHELVQLRREKRAALEKIVAIFRYGSSVAEDGKVYIAIRQAMTDRTYRNKSLLKAIDGITDKDRTMIRADLELRGHMADALNSDPNDKARIEGILGFPVVPLSTEKGEVFAGGISTTTGKELDDSAIATPMIGDTIDYAAVQKKWAAVFINTYHTFAKDTLGTGLLKTAGRGAAVVVTLGVAKFIMKSRPDTKALLTVAYQAQEDIRKLVEGDGKIPTDKDVAIVNRIKGIGALIPSVDQMKGEDSLLQAWFENGKAVSAESMVNIGLGHVAADQAFLLEIVENASPTDLLHYFGDTHSFDEMYNQFMLHIEAAQAVGAPDAVIRDHYDRAVDLQTKLLSYAPGVSHAFIHTLENTISVRAETRRVVVEKIYARLAEAYGSDEEFQGKLNQVRQAVAAKDTRTSTKVKTGSGEEDLSLGSMKDKMTSNEFRAGAEQVLEQQRMGNTKALRGISLRWSSGKKAALMASRAEYLGSGRRTMESKARSGVKREALGKDIENTDQQAQELARKLQFFDEAIALYTQIEAGEGEIQNAKDEIAKLKDLSLVKKKQTRVMKSALVKRQVRTEITKLQAEIADKEQKLLELSDKNQLLRTEADNKISTNGLLTPAQQKKLSELTNAREGAQNELHDQEQKKQKAGLEKDSLASSYDMELATRIKDMSSSRQDFDKKQAAFLALRDKVKTAVTVIVQLLIAVLVTAISAAIGAATMGAGAAGALPIWATVILAIAVSMVSTLTAKVIQRSFDPESVTLLDTAYDVLSAAIIAGITAGATQGFGGLMALGLTQVGGKFVSNDILNKAITDLLKTMVEDMVKGLSETMSAGIRSAIMTGDGEADALEKFKETVGLASLTQKLVAAGAKWAVVDLGANAAFAALKGEDLDKQGGIFRGWLGVDEPDKSAADQMKAMWDGVEFHPLADGWQVKMEQGYFNQLATTTYAISTSLIQNAATQKKNSISDSNLGSDSEGGIKHEIEIEGKEEEKPEQDEDHGDAAMQSASESLFVMGEKLGTMADSSLQNAEQAAAKTPSDMNAVKKYAKFVDNTEEILTKTFNPEMLNNLQEASSEDAGKIIGALTGWKQKVANAKSKITILLAQPPKQSPVSQPVSSGRGRK